jgi:molecular chaperone HtpG
MTVTEEYQSESRPFEADVAKLLHLMVHSVYADKSVFLRELIANAADGCVTNPSPRRRCSAMTQSRASR